jgi:hypothetical protein
MYMPKMISKLFRTILFRSYAFPLFRVSELQTSQPCMHPT